MKNIKLMVSLIFVGTVAGMNLQAAEFSNQAPEYQYGREGTRDDLFYFQEKYINKLMVNNLQLNDEELKALISEAKALWNNNNWSGWTHFRDLTEFSFIATEINVVNEAARERLSAQN